MSKQLLAYLHRVIQTLSEKEQQVITLRYGLNNDREITLEEAGNIMGVTRERIRQIEAKVFRKLHHPTRSKNLKEYFC